MDEVSRDLQCDNQKMTVPIYILMAYCGVLKSLPVSLFFRRARGRLQRGQETSELLRHPVIQRRSRRRTSPDTQVSQVGWNFSNTSRDIYTRKLHYRRRHRGHESAVVFRLSVTNIEKKNTRSRSTHARTPEPCVGSVERGSLRGKQNAQATIMLVSFKKRSLMRTRNCFSHENPE